MFPFLLLSLVCPCLPIRTQQGRFFMDAYINPQSDFILDNYFQINERLVNNLFTNFTKVFPAVYMSAKNHLKVTTVFVNITLSACTLLSIDQAKQSVQMIVELQMNWTDPRLKWNPADYYGIEMLPVTREADVWIPDALPFDTFTFSDTRSLEQQTIELFYDGTVSLYRATVVEFICLLNLKTFPFDTQECHLQIASYTYPATVMTILGTIRDNPLGSAYANYSGTGEWTLTNISVDNEYLLEGLDNETYSYLIYTFIIKRSTTYYVLLIIVPSFILTILCVVGLFWRRVNADSYIDHLGVGFAAILALMFVLQTVTQDMPKMNMTDKLSVYLLVSLILLACAIIVAMLIGESTAPTFSNEGEHQRVNHLLSLLSNRLNLIFMFIFSVATVVNFVVLIA